MARCKRPVDFLGNGSRPTRQPAVSASQIMDILSSVTQTSRARARAAAIQSGGQRSHGVTSMVSVASSSKAQVSGAGVRGELDRVQRRGAACVSNKRMRASSVSVSMP